MVNHRLWEAYNICRYPDRRWPDIRKDPVFRAHLLKKWPRWSKNDKDQFKAGIRIALSES